MNAAWPILKESPIFTHFLWSPLVRGVVERNMHRITGNSSPLRFLPFQGSSMPQTIPGLVAVHIRRGDFIEHCKNLAWWKAGYSGWNRFEEFQDKWPPSSELEEMDEHVRWDMYMEHCLPSAEQLVRRLDVVRTEAESRGVKLTRVYVLTNEKGAYKKELEEKLVADGWDGVAMSPDLEVKKAEREVVMTADMMIAQMAEVFLGNGVSNSRRVKYRPRWN